MGQKRSARRIKWIHNHYDKKDWFILDILRTETIIRNTTRFYFHVFGPWTWSWIIFYLFVICKNLGPRTKRHVSSHYAVITPVIRTGLYPNRRLIPLVVELCKPCTFHKTLLWDESNVRKLNIGQWPIFRSMEIYCTLHYVSFSFDHLEFGKESRFKRLFFFVSNFYIYLI